MNEALIDRAVEINRDRDIDALVDGNRGPEPTPLIEEFYEDFEVFKNWWLDAISSHPDYSIKCVQASMDCIRFHKEAAVNAMNRGDVMTSARYAKTAMESEATLGRTLFDMINGFMERASKEAQG